MTKAHLKWGDPEVIRALLDTNTCAIIKEVIKMGSDTKEKFLTGLKLFNNKSMNIEEAMQESGFIEAYRKELSQKKAPETDLPEASPVGSARG